MFQHTKYFMFGSVATSFCIMFSFTFILQYLNIHILSHIMVSYHSTKTQGIQPFYRVNTLIITMTRFHHFFCVYFIQFLFISRARTRRVNRVSILSLSCLMPQESTQRARRTNSVHQPQIAQDYYALVHLQINRRFFNLFRRRGHRVQRRFGIITALGRRIC